MTTRYDADTAWRSRLSAARQGHAWELSPAAARELQSAWCGKVLTEDTLTEVRHVAGIDVGFEEAGKLTRAAVVILSFPELEPVEDVVSRRATSFPYVPGLLSFREIPAVLDALEKLNVHPNLILCDGHGLAHPRRFGLASHLGVLVDLPSIGVAKTRLFGVHGPVPETRGAWVPLEDNGEVIGAVVRTRSGVKPIYVSIGHRVTLVSAVRYVLACTPRYRLPETTRRADRIASRR